MPEEQSTTFPKLKVEVRKVSELVPYAANAKEHPEKQIDEIVNSIRTFGFNDPIGVWTNDSGELEIVEGHGRVLALERMGVDKCPVVILDHLTNEQRRAYAHVHNQTTLTSGFDEDLLWEDLATMDFEWSDFGFDENVEFEGYIDVEEDAEYDEDKIEKRVEIGDLWQLGEHRLVCGSATEPEDVKRTMGDSLADCWLTDYPYGVSYVGKTEDALTIMNDEFKTRGEFQEFVRLAAESAHDVMKPGASFYVFHSSTYANVFMNGLEEAGLETRETLIWVKNSMVLGRQDYQWRHEPVLYGWKGGAAHSWYSDRSQTTCLEFDRPTRSELHPTMKPITLLAYLLENSTKPGDVVLDSFGGSGSTLIACDQIGRICNIIELDPHYCDAILHRYEEMTGDAPVLLERKSEK